MRRITLLISFIPVVTVLWAQRSEMKPEKTSTKWIKNQQILFQYSYPDSMSFSPTWRPGRNRIFEYIYQASENPDVSDDELTEIVCFQLPNTGSLSFTLKDSALIKAKAYFMRGCFCPDRGYVLLNQGIIQGKKLSDKIWSISINVTVSGSQGEYQRKYSGKFKYAKD